jgi:hypothetical protein
MRLTYLLFPSGFKLVIWLQETFKVCQKKKKCIKISTYAEHCDNMCIIKISKFSYNSEYSLIFIAYFAIFIFVNIMKSNLK